MFKYVHDKSPSFRHEVYGEALVATILLSAVLFAPNLPADDLGVTDLSLDQLANAEVISAAKKPQALSETAAAVFIISREMIRRTGASTIPELLRMVPGVAVGQIDNNRWAVGIRGFNDRLNRRLLVLVDGRPVYDQTVSGTYWEMISVPLEEIERIEVIRGPGGALWGANAINGVINILTRKATDTVGGVVSAGGGDTEQAFAAAHYGFTTGNNAYTRVQAQMRRVDSSHLTNGMDAHDGADIANAGLRMDWAATTHDNLMFEANGFDTSVDQRSAHIQLTSPYIETRDDTMRGKGDNALAHWTHQFDQLGVSDLQAFYDHTRHTELVYGIENHTADIELGHRLRFNRWQELSGSLNYRVIRSDIYGENLTTQHGTDTFSVSSISLSDETDLFSDSVKLTLGAKWERYEMVGSNIQPDIRISWQTTDSLSLWAAANRAVHTPSRTDLDVELLASVSPWPFPPPSLLTIYIIGNPDLKPELMDSYEAGSRWLAGNSLSFDLSLFDNHYHDFIATQFGAPYVDPDNGTLRFDAYPDNFDQAHVRGGELAIQWLPTEWWSLNLNISRITIDVDPVRLPSQQQGFEHNVPAKQVSLQNRFSFGSDWTVDIWERYRSEISNGSTRLPLRRDLDIDLAWHINDRLKLILAGKNLTHNRDPDFFGGSRIPRSALASIRYEW